MYKDKTSDRIKLIASNLEFRNNLLNCISKHENRLLMESFELEEVNTTLEQFKQELEGCEKSIGLFFDELRDMD